MRETSTRLQLAEIAASADGGEAKADEMRILTQYLRDQGIPKTMEELISLRDLLLVLMRPLDSRSARLMAKPKPQLDPSTIQFRLLSDEKAKAVWLWPIPSTLHRRGMP